MTEIIISVLLLLAAVVIVLASIGILRMPDSPTRMHATTKSGGVVVADDGLVIVQHAKRT